ncbi:MAG TPA: hypothetical protein VN461_15215, partial [Vicinamibacteria bacterium]|nr:hypothetical protein [Vicinamibacteria bacterium]
MDNDSSLPNKVSTSFQQLKAAAAQLNTISDELAGPVAALDAALKPLNLGISAWVKFAGDFDHDTGDFWTREIGYAKVGAKWGIALRTREGNAADPDQSIERWPFNEAPRAYRVDAVEKLPDLLETLIKEATATAEKVKGKIAYVQQVVAAIGGPPSKPTAHKAPAESPQKAALGNLLSALEQARALEQASGLSTAVQAEALRAMEQAAGLSKIEREEAIRAVEQAAGLSKVERDAAIWAMRQAASLSQMERDAAIWVMERATGFSAAAQAEALRAMEQATNRSKVSRAKPPIRPV